MDNTYQSKEQQERLAHHSYIDSYIASDENDGFEDYVEDSYLVYAIAKLRKISEELERMTREFTYLNSQNT